MVRGIRDTPTGCVATTSPQGRQGVYAVQLPIPERQVVYAVKPLLIREAWSICCVTTYLRGGKVYMLRNHLLLGRQEVNRMRIIWIWMVDWLYRLA